MPKTRKSSTPSKNLDILQASVAGLTQLPAETLCHHLSSRHLVTTGNKATMARWLYQAVHQTPITQVPTSDSINMVQQQLSSLPSLPATQQFLALPHTIVSQQPVALPSTQQLALLPTMQQLALLPTMLQPIASLAQQSVVSQQPITLPSRKQPSLLSTMQQPVASLALQSVAL